MDLKANLNGAAFTGDISISASKFLNLSTISSNATNDEILLNDSVRINGDVYYYDTTYKNLKTILAGKSDANNSNFTGVATFENLTTTGYIKTEKLRINYDVITSYSSQSIGGNQEACIEINGNSTFYLMDGIGTSSNTDKIYIKFMSLSSDFDGTIFHFRFINDTNNYYRFISHNNSVTKIYKNRTEASALGDVEYQSLKYVQFLFRYVSSTEKYFYVLISG